MNASRLIKFAPTAILFAFLGYASFSLQAALPGAAEKEAALAKGLELMLNDLAKPESWAVGETGRLRNPFLAVTPPAATPDAPEPDATALPQSDPLAEIVAGLSLDATFLQGRDQIAIINGKIYHKGQRLNLPDDDESRPPIVVHFVKQTGVILRGGGKNYLLGYPEHLVKKSDAAARADAREAEAKELDPAGQSAMFAKLLNSPLGALGKGLIGDAVSSKRPAGSRSSARARRSGTSPSGSTNP
jgi:hypothetical protein